RRRNRSSRSTQPAQPFLQLSAGVVEAAHYRSPRTLEHVTDLLVGEPIHFSEEYYRSMFRGQLGNGPTESLGDLGITRALIGIALLVGIGQPTEQIFAGAFAGAGLQVRLRELRFAALVVYAKVHGDAVGPGVEAGVALEAIQALIGFGEGVLHDVERVLAISQHPECQSGDPALVALGQLPEGVPIAIPSLLDELPIARPHGTSAYQTVRCQGYSAAARAQPWTSAQFAPECTSTRRGTRRGQ